jgi:carbamoyltransferase
MNVLGISANHHDSASCLFAGGRLVAAVQEERFSRVKHDGAFPSAAIRYCLSEGRLSLADIDLVAFYENGKRQLSRQLGAAQGSLSLLARLNLNPHRARDEVQRRLGLAGRFVEIDHHESHAHAAHFLSGFDDCAILVCDGVGEWQTTTMWRVVGGEFEPLAELRFPDSLGLFFATVTAFLGFGVNCDEYKVMGLAAYGCRDAANRLRSVIRWSGDHGFELEPRFFEFLGGVRMYSDAFVELVGFPPRQAGEPILQQHRDLAAAAQQIIEEAMVRMTRHLARISGQKKLCVSGGVAHNAAANRVVVQEAAFQEYFFQPAAGDEGSAIGAAVAALRKHGSPAASGRRGELFVGPAIDMDAVLSLLQSLGVAFELFDDMEQACARAARLLDRGTVLGWVQGRAEFGPRALGARSILADARDPKVKDKINQRVKFREDFRPFAPAVLEEHAGDCFDIRGLAPYMTVNALVRYPDLIPGATHVDQTARLQTVARDPSHPLRGVLEHFHALTGVPALLNTSFNVRGEPMVLGEADALRTFVHSGLDHLFLGRVLVARASLPTGLENNLRKPRFFEATGEARPAVYTFF